MTLEQETGSNRLTGKPAGNGSEAASRRASVPAAKATGAKQCFVISPIGAEGSETREHADDVFDYIIKPAAKRLGIVAERSDHLHEPGRISEQMLRAILEYDLCIAVLTFHNPNVFYELAIAQATNRPVIILLEKGSVLPFDIQDMRCVYYDLKPRSLFNRVAANEIVNHVSTLQRTGWNGSGLPGVSVPGLNDGPCTVLPTADEFGRSADWLELFSHTHRSFAVAGINLHDWRKTKGFKEELICKAQDGCRIRVAVMDPENPAFPALINEFSSLISLSEVRVGVEESRAYFEQLAADCPGVQLRTIRRGCPHFNLTITDEAAVAIPYLYSARTANSPLLRSSPGSPLYGTFVSEFETLWDANA